jgi:anti-anti-sigma factor
MSTVGTIRMYRPDPASISNTERHGRATMSVRGLTATRIQIAAGGDIDAVNGRALGRYVERHTGLSKQMILDLRAVDFFGTQGFTALYYIKVHCTRSDVDWIVIGSPPVRRMLHICDPERELPFGEDFDAAIARLDRAAKYRRRTASAG